MGEGGIHVPLVISGPDISQPGRRVGALVNSTDLFSTIVELAGGKAVLERMDVALDSISLVPYLQNAATGPLRDWAFIDTGNAHRRFRHAVIEGDHKLLLRSDLLRLYDLKNDPYEQKDLLKGSPSDQTALRTRALFSRFIELYRSEDDPFTDVNIEDLTARYRKLLCSEIEAGEDVARFSLLPCAVL